jgi:hypothetical protein
MEGTLWEFKYNSIESILGVYVPLSFSQAARPVMYLLINVLAFYVSLYLLAVFRDRIRRRGLPYPPGPPSRPIIGNLLHIPKDAPWAVYADMSNEYGRRYILSNTTSSSLPQLTPAFQGDVICFRVFNQVIVVLCSLSAIKDLFEKRAESYSDRPTLPILEMYT